MYSFKLWLFKVRWHWKNRKWKDCRQKQRAYERERWDYVVKLSRRRMK